MPAACATSASAPRPRAGAQPRQHQPAGGDRQQDAELLDAGGGRSRLQRIAGRQRERRRRADPARQRHRPDETADGDVAANVSGAIPPDTTTMVSGTADARRRARALHRAAIAHAQPHQHAERGERDRHHGIERRQRGGEEVDAVRAEPDADREQQRDRGRRRRPLQRPAPAPGAARVRLRARRRRATPATASGERRTDRTDGGGSSLEGRHMGASPRVTATSRRCP